MRKQEQKRKEDEEVLVKTPKNLKQETKKKKSQAGKKQENQKQEDKKQKPSITLEETKETKEKEETAKSKDNKEKEELTKSESKEESKIEEKKESKHTKKRTNESKEKEKEEISTENQEEEQKEETALSKIDIKSKEFLEKIEKERKNQKQVPEDKMKLAHIVVAKNIVIAVGFLLYFFLFKMAFITLEPVYFVTLMNAFSIITIVFTIIIFEIAYKKDSDVLAIHGIEMMFLAITTLLFKLVYMNYMAFFIRTTTIVAILFAIYYAIKATRIYIKARKKFKNNTREIEEIIKTKK